MIEIDTDDVDPAGLVDLVVLDKDGKEVALQDSLSASEAALAQSYIDKKEQQLDIELGDHVGEELGPISDAEKEAYEKYREFQDNHGKIKISGKSGSDYDPGKSYIDQPDRVDDPTVPDVPKYDSADNKAQLQVSTDALRTFAKNLRTLQGHIATARDTADAVMVKPGFFPAGNALAGAVQGSNAGVPDKGDGGLRGKTVHFLAAVVEAFEDLNTDIGTLVKEYDSAEELNGLKGKDLNNTFRESFSGVKQLGSQAK